MDSKISACVFFMVAIVVTVVPLAEGPITANHQAFALQPACLATSSCGVYYGPCVQEHAQFSYAWCAKIFPIK